MLAEPTSCARNSDLICFSHLRWNFVFQRPQHLMVRCARERHVFYFEEPRFIETAEPWLQIERSSAGVTILTPHIPESFAGPDVARLQRELLDEFVGRERITRYLLWYYTPMALDYTDHLQPEGIVYDCMDELSAFANAPATLKALEVELFRRACVVFTGGQSLYEAKRRCHDNVHAFPSSVDVEHFAAARRITGDPADQASIGRPRLGFFGVIDERMDIELLAGVADARPEWQIVLLGPVVKIDPAILPRRENIHYLGSKTYAELPAYVAGWDVALLPFARNDATRYISPTKTPEYMASGKPVVSTSIRDVVRPYGQNGLVRIADTVDEFVTACEAALSEDATVRMRDADAFLRQTSWDGTWAQMRHQLEVALGATTEPARAAGSL